MDPRLLRVDRDGVLSIPASLWWCMLFLLRHSMLLVVVLVTWLSGGGSSSWVYGLMSWPVVLCEAPMWLLLCAGLRRAPGAGSGVRWSWRHGRELITLAVLLNLVWTGWLLWDSDTWSPWPERFLFVVGLIEVVVLAAVWRSALYRQVFAEFPAQSGPQLAGGAPAGPNLPEKGPSR